MEKVINRVPLSKLLQGCSEYHFLTVIHKTLFMGFCKNSILVENGNTKKTCSDWFSKKNLPKPLTSVAAWAAVRGYQAPQFITESKFYTYTPNFIGMCSLCRLPVAENHNFEQILTFRGLLYRPTFTDEGKFGVL